MVTGAFAKMATLVSDNLFGVSRGASVLTAVVAVIVGAVAFRSDGGNDRFVNHGRVGGVAKG